MNNEVIIIIPENYNPETKDCPVCSIAFSSKDDIINYRKHGCCLSCDEKYRYTNKEKWEEGWRPDN